MSTRMRLARFSMRLGSGGRDMGLLGTRPASAWGSVVLEVRREANDRSAKKTRVGQAAPDRSDLREHTLETYIVEGVGSVGGRFVRSRMHLQEQGVDPDRSGGAD